MFKKDKMIIILISVLLVSNIYFAYNFSRVTKEINTLNRGMLARADRAIDEAVNNILELNDEWEEKSDLEKMKSLEDAYGNLTLAMELMSGAGRFFLPVKTYRDGIYTLEQKIMNKIDENIQKEYIEGLDNDFRVLWRFIADFMYSEMTREEAREKWKGVVKDLKTKEIYSNF